MPAGSSFSMTSSVAGGNDRAVLFPSESYFAAVVA